MNPDRFHAPPLEAMNRRLPAFDFKALIAEGPTAAVFMARQRSLEREVAIKFLSPEVGTRADFRQAFEETARTMARLNHPNLISVYDSGMVDGMLYFVMEFVPGKSLERSAHGHRVELAQTLKLIDGICAGLGHAHDHGIVHGNLCPANILLNRKAEPKIGNFGFAHPEKSAASEESRISPFAAPELADPASKPTPASDIHSLGAILYQLLTARPHSASAPPPSTLADCPPAIDAIWRKATHPDPGQRHTNVAGFRQALAAGVAKSPAASLHPATTAGGASRPAESAGTLRNSPPQPPANDPKDAPPETQPVHRVGLNWKLLRNLVIIAGLLFAIKHTWEFKERKTAEAQRRNLEAEAKAKAEQERALAEARTRPIPGTRQDKPSGNTDRPEPIPETETPEQSLARLRSALVEGSREEMPVGSQRRGDCDYLLVNRELSWPEAAWFAERHGGHLAIPNAAADLTWLVTQLGKGTAIWIGGGRSGRSAWALADGTVWQPKKEPTGLGPYLGADQHGFLRAGGGHVRLPFIIQWHRDGSNPCAMDKVLAATRQSLVAGKPVFPAGTQVFGSRYFLVVSRDVAWTEASDLASASGGHLAVASDIAETTQLQEALNGLPAEARFWLGGRHQAGAWTWLTGEPWKTRLPYESAPPAADVGLWIGSKRGFGTAPANLALPGFIIEWSNDRRGVGGSGSR